ncbi:gfo/Idh/MocA family oxidoreductase [bacterium]|nr:MAG: gfo/Idh/MocA family oxidoreductase [bacterium]
MREYLDARIKERLGQQGAPARTLGLGVVGLHEGRTLLAAMNRTRHIRAVAACDIDEEKLAAIQKEFPDLYCTPDYRELISRPDVDVVAIYTPDATHGKLTVQAFEAGKDVICTKPLVNSVADAKMVLQAGRKSGRKLLVGQSTRFFESFQRQRRAFEHGDFGHLELADAHYIHRMDWYYEKSPWVATGTDWVFLGLSHPVDLIRWYLGPIEEVHAFGYTSELGKKYGVRGFDVYVVNLRGMDRRIGRVMGHYGLHELPSARNSIELMLYGSKSSSLAQYHDMRYKYTRDDGTEVCEDPLYERRHYYFNSEIHGMHYGEFANYAEYFAQALITGSPYSPDLEEGIETFCVMETVRRSARTGKPAAVEPLLNEVGVR